VITAGSRLRSKADSAYGQRVAERLGLVPKLQAAE
jgi:hypothetical protein